MECLCHANLPCLCLGTAYHPSVTMGGPVRAPKQAKIRVFLCPLSNWFKYPQVTGTILRKHKLAFSSISKTSPTVPIATILGTPSPICRRSLEEEADNALIGAEGETSQEFISLMINLRPRESTKTRNEADGLRSKRSSSVLPEVNVRSRHVINTHHFSRVAQLMFKRVYLSVAHYLKMSYSRVRLKLPKRGKL